MANITTQTIRVDLSTDKVIPSAFTHQNDTARTLEFSMYNKGVPYTMTGNTVKFAYKSPIVDGAYTVITGSGMASGTVSGNKVTVTLPSEYTAISGVGMLTMIITPTSGTVRPVNIRLVVQKSADGDDTIMGASDWPDGLYDYMDDWLEENEPTEIANLKSDLNSIAEKVQNLYSFENVILGKNWAGGDAANRAYIQIPVTSGKEYTVLVPQNSNIPQVAVVQLNSARAPLGSFYITGGNRESFIAVTNCVSIRIQFEGTDTLTSADFENYNVEVFEGVSEYSSAVDDVARKHLRLPKKYIFIGDSYCEGYNPDGNVTGWGSRLKTALNLSDDNCTIKCKGGTGFYHVSDGKTFSTLLDEAGSEVTKSEITDIVVCGGWNDNSESLSNVYNAVLSFIAKVRSEYSSANVYIGMIGASTDSAVKTRLQDTVLYAYQYGALADVCNYLNNVEYALAESNLASDGIHPNADGQVQITIAVKQAIETGSAYIPYGFYNQIKTS